MSANAKKTQADPQTPTVPPLVIDGTTQAGKKDEQAKDQAAKPEPKDEAKEAQPEPFAEEAKLLAGCLAKFREAGERKRDWSRQELLTAMDGGAVLTKVQAGLPAGKWLEWLAKHFVRADGKPLSRATAANWQRLDKYREKILTAIEAGKIKAAVGKALGLVAKRKGKAAVAPLTEDEQKALEGRIKAAGVKQLSVDSALRLLASLGIAVTAVRSGLKQPMPKLPPKAKAAAKAKPKAKAKPEGKAEGVTVV